MLDYVPFGSAMFLPLSLFHTIVFKIIAHEPLGGVHVEPRQRVGDMYYGDWLLRVKFGTSHLYFLTHKDHPFAEFAYFLWYLNECLPFRG